MPDELTGTTVTENPVSTGTEANPEDGKSKESGKAPENQPEIDPRYAGKSPAELVGIIREQEKIVGRMGERLGKVDVLESEVTNLRDYLLRQEQGRQQPVTPPQQEEIDLANPTAWFEKKLEARDKALREQYSRAEQQRAYDEAVANFTTGRRQAVQTNKELFDGIENEVSDALWATVRANPGVRHSLRDPDVWEKAARMIRLERGEYDRIIPKKAAPVKPAATELPGRTVRQLTDDDDVELTDEDREQARAEGWTEKEALEAKKAGLDMVRKGQFTGRQRR